MGIGGISVWQLLIILAIVMLLFGTSRLRPIGGDLGAAVRGFRGAMQDSPDIERDAVDAEYQDDVATGNNHDVHKESPTA